jgi:type I restriction enzyme S subunit
VTLTEAATFQRGSAITQKQTLPGSVPVVANGPDVVYTHDTSNRTGETVVVARSGAHAGSISFWNEPIFLTDAFSVHPDEQSLRPRFLYYYLFSRQRTIRASKKGAGVPHVRVKDLERFPLPVPSLAEQDRIVDILDQFDALVNDLSIGLPAELAARRNQYEYYRNRLLTFEEAS